MAVFRRGVGARTSALAGALLLASGLPVNAQKSGGTLRIYNTTQPPSASIHEESTIATNMPFMAVFNNLVRFDPQKPRNSFDTIVPDLAESWAWDATGTKLTFKLRYGRHLARRQALHRQGRAVHLAPLNGKEPEYFRRNPRAIWYENLKEVTLNGDYEVTFHLTKPQPSLLQMLASGLSPVYPCHVSDRRHAHQAGRHGAVQVRRVQEPRLDQAGAQSRLLEEGPALPRCDRVAHHRQPLDARAGLRGRRVRHDVRRRHHRAADEGRHGQAPNAICELAADQRSDQHPGQPRRAAVRQRAAAPRHGAGARPPVLHRHRLGRQGQHRRQHDAAAGGPMGDAARDAPQAAGLRPGRGGAAGPKRARSWKAWAMAPATGSR